MRKILAVLILVFGVSILVGCGQPATRDDSIKKPLSNESKIKPSRNGPVLPDKKNAESNPPKTIKNSTEKIMVESKSPNDKEMQDVYNDIEKEIQGLMSDLEQLEEDSGYIEQSQVSSQEVGS